eukprot:Blabericola_migrator_1__4932@NODE_2572_length_2587_cov_150_202778_g1610_i0_p1_GENE_NODE_2572_length_2587_cov_150_202778_g1610_i0NODE_2572_length_2587_cov_150_202778_g1610_i0_p1_ORF_typecomplete_len131_score11_33DUF3540/PF12059_8/0_16_NODE_2572_length_2587_cov_150_202778_g1610_i019712363
MLSYVTRWVFNTSRSKPQSTTGTCSIRYMYPRNPHALDVVYSMHTVKQCTRHVTHPHVTHMSHTYFHMARVMCGTNTLRCRHAGRIRTHVAHIHTLHGSHSTSTHTKRTHMPPSHTDTHNPKCLEAQPHT